MMNDNLVQDPVTIDELKRIAPDLFEDNSSLNETTINATIEQATMQVLADQLPEFAEVNGKKIGIQHMGIKYLSLHMITVFYGYTGGENIISQKVDQTEQHFADPSKLDWYQSSPWGKLYATLLDKYTPTATPMKVEY